MHPEWNNTQAPVPTPPPEPPKSSFANSFMLTLYTSVAVTVAMWLIKNSGVDFSTIVEFFKKLHETQTANVDKNVTAKERNESKFVEKKPTDKPQLPSHYADEPIANLFKLHPDGSQVMLSEMPSGFQPLRADEQMRLKVTGQGSGLSNLGLSSDDKGYEKYDLSRADPDKVKAAKAFRDQILADVRDRDKQYQQVDRIVRNLQRVGMHRDARDVARDFWKYWTLKDSHRRQLLKIQSPKAATVYARSSNSHLELYDCWPFAHRDGTPAGILMIAEQLEGSTYLVTPVEGQFLWGDFIVVR